MRLPRLGHVGGPPVRPEDVPGRPEEPRHAGERPVRLALHRGGARWRAARAVRRRASTATQTGTVARAARRLPGIALDLAFPRNAFVFASLSICIIIFRRFDMTVKSASGRVPERLC